MAGEVTMGAGQGVDVGEASLARPAYYAAAGACKYTSLYSATIVAEPMRLQNVIIIYVNI